MKPKLVFICAPFRGNTPFEIHQNCCVVEDWAEELVKDGLFYIAPHLNSRNFQGLGPTDATEIHHDEFWLDMYQDIMLRCDAVLQVGRVSEGVEQEVLLAWAKGIPVFRDLTELTKWATAQSGVWC
jgi:hypothetical protein